MCYQSTPLSLSSTLCVSGATGIISSLYVNRLRSREAVSRRLPDVWKLCWQKLQRTSDFRC